MIPKFVRKLANRVAAPSTRALFIEGLRTPGYSLFDFIHGYVYARWTYLYIGLGTGAQPLPRWLALLVRFVPRIPFAGRITRSRLNPLHHPKYADRYPTFAEGYHGKVLPLKAATELVQIHEPVRLQNLEKILPYARARDLILKNPDHILALECPCRSARENPCLPLDVCLIVGEPFASFITEHHPGRSRRISVDEAVEILQAEDERGHVHHAFFKDAMLGRFYAICNCCACCCGAIQFHNRGTPMLASSGYVSHVDSDLCIGCGECQDTCQFGALTLADYQAVVDEALCMGCGVCVSKCEQGALELVRSAGKGEPLEILELMSAA